MKTKSIMPAIIFALFLSPVFGKYEFNITVQNLTADSSNGLNIYYHVSSGSDMTITGLMHIVEVMGTYDGPPDSAHWFADGMPAGSSYGGQLMSFNQPGNYTATCYYNGIVLSSQQTIVLTVNVPAAIVCAEAPAISIAENAAMHLLEISNVTKNYVLRIYTVTGTLVRNEEVKAANRVVSLSGIGEGIYFITIITEEQTITRKMYVR